MNRFVIPVCCLLLAGGVGTGAKGCLLDSDVDDFTFQLPEKTYQIDTAEIELPARTAIACSAAVDPCPDISADLQCNQSAGLCELKDSTRVPSVACSETDDPCAEIGDEFTCDLEAGTCRASFAFELVSAVHLSDEVPELETVGNTGLASVRFEYVRMKVVENTLTMPTPPVEIFVAPQAVATLYEAGSNPPRLNAGVVQVGTMPSIAAATSGMSVDVETTAAGDSALTAFCREPAEPFNFLTLTVIELAAGQPLPQGAVTLEVDAVAVASLD